MMNTIKSVWNEVKEGVIEGYNSNLNFNHRTTKLLKKYGIQADVLIVDLNNGLAASVLHKDDLHLVGLQFYPVLHDTVLLVDEPAIRKMAMRLPTKHPVFEDITTSQLLDVILAHELGHLMNNHVHSNEHVWKRDILRTVGMESLDTHRYEYALMGELTLEQEQEAWDTGKAYIKDTLVPMYNMYNYINMQAYKQIFNTTLKDVRFK